MSMSLVNRCLAVGLALGLAGATLSQASAASSSAPGPQASTATAPASKPFAPGTVTIDPASITVGSPDVSVEVVPDPSLTAATVTVTSTGQVEVDEDDQAVATDVSSTVSVEAGAPSGPSTITATLVGDPSASGTDRVITDTVWLDEVGGTVLVSNTGTQDLQLKVIDLREEKGLITSVQAEAARREALGGTSSTVSATTSASCAAVCISGTVRWTDSAGNLHPVRKAPVQIYDDEPGTDQLLATVTTDASGAYEGALADNDDGPGESGRDVYVRVLAAGPAFTINGKYIQSAVNTDVPTGTDLAIAFTANDVADNNTAFSLQNAMVIAGEYVLDVRGSAFPTIGIVFPSTGGSYYDGTYLQVDGGDRWDWDVMLHEYGHYVMDKLNIEANPGGDHSSEENLSDTRGKAVGVPLAWGEGWPTYFAVSLLREMGASSLGIPNIGDTFYQDTEDQVITQNLETGGTLGEDNEFTVMSVLWDLYDSTDDGLDHVSLGTDAIWDLLDANDPTTLSAATKLFAPGVAASDLAADCIFSQYNVSPRLSGSATATVPAGSASPTLTWSRGNGGSHRNNRFTVEYRNAAGALLFSSPAITSTSYQAPAPAWDAARISSGGTIDVTVKGTQTDAPVTGPYRSCARQFTVDTARSAEAAWVAASYADFLGRAPTAGELSRVLTRRAAGTSRAAIARELSTSDEWLGAIVTDLYQDTLGRAPDPSGLAYWRNKLRTGTLTVAQVAAAFYSSSEYYRNVGGGTPQTWVDDLYVKLLGRPADPAGRTYWVNKVASKGRDHVAREFYGSAESRRARVDALYQRLLGRAPDRSGRAYWANKIATEGDLALAVNLVTSSEYATKAAVRFP